MTTLDLACGEYIDGDYGMDLRPIKVPPGKGFTQHDLTSFPWPLPDGSFDKVVSHAYLEHIERAPKAADDPVYKFFREIYRILKPGGVLTFDTPHYQSEAAFWDLDHRRFYTPNSFKFLWDPNIRRWGERDDWELVYNKVSRRFPGWYGCRKRFPNLYWSLCRTHLGKPLNIEVEVRKPLIARSPLPPAPPAPHAHLP
jgi:SAM-dependent methyltransferase